MLKVLNLKVIGSLRSVKSVKPNSNWKPKKLEVLKVLNLIRWKMWELTLFRNRITVVTMQSTLRPTYIEKFDEKEIS